MRHDIAREQKRKIVLYLFAIGFFASERRCGIFFGRNGKVLPARRFGCFRYGLLFRNSFTRSENDDAKKQVKAVPDFHLYGASRLYERDRRRYDDIVDRTAAREIAYRLGKTLQDRAVRICMGEALHEFIADVSG